MTCHQPKSVRRTYPRLQHAIYQLLPFQLHFSLGAEEGDWVCHAMGDVGAQMGDFVVDVGEEGETRPPGSLHDNQVVSIEFHGHRPPALKECEATSSARIPRFYGKGKLDLKWESSSLLENKHPLLALNDLIITSTILLALLVPSASRRHI